MAYNLGEWRDRIAQRSDMSTSIVHLTRENEKDSVSDVLCKILKDKKIIGSSTTSGFICGNDVAVCFQDVPLASICQNVYYEQNRIKDKKDKKIRYRAVGLLFQKDYVFKKGGRPVIYDKTQDAKNYLREGEWWRIVNMKFNDVSNIIDWSHEREWRIKGDFDFELEEATILLANYSLLKPIVEKIKKDLNFDIRDKIKGIVTLTNVLY